MLGFGIVFALVSKPISLALEILNAVLGHAVETRADVWFLDMGCGSGNVTIAARLSIRPERHCHRQVSLRR